MYQYLKSLLLGLVIGLDNYVNLVDNKVLHSHEGWFFQNVLRLYEVQLLTSNELMKLMS